MAGGRGVLTAPRSGGLRTACPTHLEVTLSIGAPCDPGGIFRRSGILGKDRGFMGDGEQRVSGKNSVAFATAPGV